MESNDTESASQLLNYYIPVALWLNYATVGAVLLGLATNLANFCVFWCEPVRRHYLSTGLRILSANDFLLLLLFLAMNRLNLHHTSQYACFITHYLYGLVTMISPWLLVVITIDRLVFLRKPRLTTVGRHSRRICGFMKLVLAGSLAWNLHYKWTVGFGHYHRNRNNGTRLCVATGTMHTQSFQLADSTIVSFLPGLLLLLFNCYIMCQVRQLVRSLERQRSNNCGGGGGPDSPQFEAANPTAQQQQQVEMTALVATANGGDERNNGTNNINNNSNIRSCTCNPSVQNQDWSLEQLELTKSQCQITRMLLGFCFAYLAFNLPNYVGLMLGQLLFAASLDSYSPSVYAAYNIMRLCSQLLYMLHFSTNSLIYAYANKLFRVALANFIIALKDGFVVVCCCCYWCGNRFTARDSNINSDQLGH